MREYYSNRNAPALIRQTVLRPDLHSLKKQGRTNAAARLNEAEPQLGNQHHIGEGLQGPDSTNFRTAENQKPMLPTAPQQRNGTATSGVRSVASKPGVAVHWAEG